MDAAITEQLEALIEKSCQIETEYIAKKAEIIDDHATLCEQIKAKDRMSVMEFVFLQYATTDIMAGASNITEFFSNVQYAWKGRIEYLSNLETNLNAAQQSGKSMTIRHHASVSEGICHMDLVYGNKESIFSNVQIKDWRFKDGCLEIEPEGSYKHSSNYTDSYGSHVKTQSVPLRKRSRKIVLSYEGLRIY